MGIGRKEPFGCLSPPPSLNLSEMKNRGSIILLDFTECRGQELLMTTPGPALCWGNMPTCWRRNSCQRSYQTLRVVAWYHRREVRTHGMRDSVLWHKGLILASPSSENSFGVCVYMRPFVQGLLCKGPDDLYTCAIQNRPASRAFSSGYVCVKWWLFSCLDPHKGK